MLSTLGATIGYIIFETLKHDAKKYIIICLLQLAQQVLCSLPMLLSTHLLHTSGSGIKVALGIVDDLRGYGYNVNQSKIAIGSGGVTGKGFLNGTQTKLKYVPEQRYRFYFSVQLEKNKVLSEQALFLFYWLL